jgi:cytochrome c biogenesis protein CcmG, thiol:disulfide interchange protein DsbE
MAASAVRRRPDLRRLPLPVLVVGALVPLVLIALLVALRVVNAPTESPTAIGNVAPDFRLTDLNGDAVRLSDYRGRPVIVNFWASWCGPCIEEFPLLRDAAEAHADEGLAVIGIVYEDRSEAARDFMERNGGTWPAAMDPGGTTAAAYTIFAPPETYFIGRDGRIVARQIGQFSRASLEQKVAAIINER